MEAREDSRQAEPRSERKGRVGGGRRSRTVAILHCPAVMQLFISQDVVYRETPNKNSNCFLTALSVSSKCLHDYEPLW